MRIIHSSDWHLKDKDIEEAEKCLRFLIETAKAEAVDLIIIAGDTFDSQDIRMGSLSASLAIKTVSALADIAPVAIILGTPSHDGKAPEILGFAKGRFPIHVASMPEQVCLFSGEFFKNMSGCTGTPSTIITLIPQPTKQFFQTTSGISESDTEVGSAMTGLFAGFGAQAAEFDYPPHILVYHGTIAGSRLPNGQALTGLDIAVSTDQLNLSHADAVMCGHIHLPQILSENIFYSGSIYANNWGENHKHGFWLHEFTGKALTKSQFVETPTKKLLRIQHDFVKNPPIEEMDVVLYGVNDFDEFKNAFVRCDFTVYQDEAGNIDKGKIESFLLSAGALEVDVRIIRIPRQNVRSEAVLKAESLRDKIQKMAEIKGEEVEWSVLLKAELIEGKSPDELIEAVGREVAV